VNNVRLILEIEQIATPYNMTLSNIQYDTTDNASLSTNGVARATPVVQGGTTPTASQQDYVTFNLEFSTSGTYDNFISFTKDLESNLRIVDISSISFSSDSSIGTAIKAGSPDIYSYDFKIKTYWLKS